MPPRTRQPVSGEARTRPPSWAGGKHWACTVTAKPARDGCGGFPPRRLPEQLTLLSAPLSLPPEVSGAFIWGRTGQWLWMFSLHLNFLL